MRNSFVQKHLDFLFSKSASGIFTRPELIGAQDKMALSTLAIFVLGVSIALVRAASLEKGIQCGQLRCSVDQYCSPFDSQCVPCSNLCDSSTQNHEAKDCIKYCQAYLHNQYEELRVDVQRLKTQTTVMTTISCLSILVVLYLIARTFLRWKSIKSTLQGTFTRNWVKKATNNNKVQSDVEVGPPKQNGLKLSMPTISATVTSVESTTNSNSTPNTTSTPLSRRHPSEDTTLDYAYDNPAMTPSPEAAQLRTKRESSF